MVLSGNNTFSGGTTVESGVLAIGADSVFNTPGDPGSGIVSSAIGTGMLTVNGGALLAGGNFTVANAMQIRSGAVIYTDGYDFTYAGNISEAGAPPEKLAIYGYGGGTVVLSGVNSHTGGTTVVSGSVQANNSSAVGTGTVTLDGSSFIAGANNLSFSNQFEIDNFHNTNGGIIDNGGMTLTLSGVIANGFVFITPGNVEFDGSGTTILTGDSTYTGTTILSGGTTLQLGDGGTTGSIVGDTSSTTARSPSIAPTGIDTLLFCSAPMAAPATSSR